jgi:hypothetical protein
MTDTSAPAESDRGMWPIYVGVILIEIVVIAGLWFFSRHFGT